MPLEKHDAESLLGNSHDYILPPLRIKFELFKKISKAWNENDTGFYHNKPIFAHLIDSEL